jgi:tripeptidyl-peptidase-2
MRTAALVVTLFTVAACSGTPRAVQQEVARPHSVVVPSEPVATSTLSEAPSYQPKEETGAAAFLASHPSADGRGIVVAILDTGVDPGATGLQTTPDGRPKIIDVVDGTGSGDVDTSTIVESEDGHIEGLTGRVLAVAETWNNPSGQWRIGLKSAWELYPGPLVARMKTERRRVFDEQHRGLVAHAASALEAHRSSHDSLTDEQQRERDELEARVDRLEALAQGYDDPGPVFDCVVFHDGTQWRGVIDTDEDGDLGEERVLTNYRLEREYGTFSDDDLLNYAMNIYQEGDLLSIVVDAGTHGTHVAGTVAAHFPGQSDLNGIAPGAQIVSVKIGDTRIGSTSLGTGEVRGLIAVLQNHCNLINMSYGGSTGFPDSGQVIELYREIVNEHGVIFVASAGNAGPNLTTVGAPGGTTTEVIGVGAVISKAMMHDQYAHRAPFEDLHYTWSSRGPTSDGDLGVVISAPGGAISPVPNWALQRHTLMNGTSMASPNACGSIALLLSGLHESGQSWTPHSIRRALENTARDVPGMDRFSLGAGMIDVPAAWAYLQANSARTDDAVRYDVTTSGRQSGRGVYLREAWEQDRPETVSVRVAPVFPRDASKRDRVDFEQTIRFTTTADWVAAPDQILLMHGGRGFSIEVDPTQLKPGAHFAEVLGFDAHSDTSGPLFRVPVTVTRLVHLDSSNAWSLTERRTYAPGEMKRWFVDVPHGATWLDVEIERVDETSPKRLIVHATQLLPDRPYTDTNHRQYVTFRDDPRALVSIPAFGGRVMELTIAQYWSSLDEGVYDVTVSAHGLVPSVDPVSMDGNRQTTRVDVRAPLGPETLDPSGSLTFARRWLQSKTRTIEPLSADRDQLPEGRRIHEMVLDYPFSLKDDASVRIWEADLPETRDYQSTMIMIYDDSKQLMYVDVSDDWHKLTKGEYLARYHVRHHDRSQLEPMDDVPLRFDRKLSKSITVSARAHPGNSGHSDRLLRHGETEAVHLRAPSPKTQNANADPGDMLVGTVRFGSSSKDTVGAGSNPDGYPLFLSVAQPAIAMKKPEATQDEEDAEDEPATQEAMDEAVHAARLKHAADFDHEHERDSFEAFMSDRMAEDPSDLDAMRVQLEWTVDDDTYDDEQEHASSVVRVSDMAIALIDADAVAAWYGREHDAEDADEEDGVPFKEQRSLLIDALMAKAVAQSTLIDDADDDTRGDRQRAFEETWSLLEAWGDPVSMDDDGFELSVTRERRRNRMATALGMVDDRIATHPQEQPLYELRLELLEELGWGHLASAQRNDLLRRFPDSYQPF